MLVNFPALTQPGGITPGDNGPQLPETCHEGEIVKPGRADPIDSSELFDGFSSNAVMSIIAVMIIGAGLDKTGIMSRVANWILRKGGSTESRITPLISGAVGIISSFMQNVGAAALFLPVVSFQLSWRISRRA